MLRVMITGAALLVGLPNWGMDDPPKEAQAQAKPQTPGEQFHALVKEFNDAQAAYRKALKEAKTPEERQKVERPSVAKYEGQILDLAKKNPDEPFAVDALVWVMQHNPQNDEALALLAKDHAQDKSVGKMAQNLMFSRAPSAEKLLRAILERNPDHAAQGQAAFGLAKYLKAKADKAHADTKEAEKYFALVTEKYADIPYYGNKKLGDAAKSSLFEIQHLGVGMTVPEIEGQDIDEKAFKLSDYRGKVVLIDFWGNW